MKNIFSAISLFLTLFAFVFIAVVFSRNVGDLSELSLDLRFDYKYLVLFFFTITSAVTVIGYGWIRILRSLEPDLSIPGPTLFRILFISWIARYIPTKMFTLVLRVSLTRSFPVSSRSIIVSSLIDFMFQFAALSLLSLPIIILGAAYYFPYFAKELFFIFWLVFTTSALLIFIKKFRKIFIFLLARYGKIDMALVSMPKPSSMISIFFIYVIGMFLWGLSLFFLINSLEAVQSAKFLEIISIAAFASAIGFFIIFLPAGIGAREAILFVLLRAYVPINVALVIPILFRLASIVAEVVLLAASWAIERVFVDKEPKK